MGRNIACEKRKDPEERSRLWSFEDINNVLTKNTGTKQIQCIGLEMHEPKNRIPFKIVDIKFPIKVV
ncbi:hypothetical protein CMV_014034 [Castanea mollissima]|uniref:Uncharacterized protein n=1 Tax=Castanea mollissima TaxID=60419 RepID=A0A8J4VUW8_9ROSI|nr:hypothetical protein CMV_014034 [Castanea mollissima]